MKILAFEVKKPQSLTETAQEATWYQNIFPLDEKYKYQQLPNKPKINTNTNFHQKLQSQMWSKRFSFRIQ